MRHYFCIHMKSILYINWIAWFYSRQKRKGKKNCTFSYNLTSWRDQTLFPQTRFQSTLFDFIKTFRRSILLGMIRSILPSAHLVPTTFWIFLVNVKVHSYAGHATAVARTTSIVMCINIDTAVARGGVWKFRSVTRPKFFFILSRPSPTVDRVW